MENDGHWKELFSAIQDEEWNDAIKSIDGLISQEPADPEHFIKLADIHIRAGSKSNALIAFRRALRLYRESGQTARAIVACKKILEMNPECPDIVAELDTLLKMHKTRNQQATAQEAAGPGTAASDVHVALEGLRKFAQTEGASELLRILLSDEVASRLQQTSVIKFSAGDIIIREGETGNSIFIIVSGGVEVSSLVQGQRVPLAALMAGDVFGEMAFLTSHPRTATVTASSSLELIEISKPLLDTIVETSPLLLRYLFNFYMSRMEATLAEFKRSSGSSFSGSLRDMPLPDIMQVFEQTKKEGVLFITSGQTEGSISFSQGRIEDASCGEKTAEEAVIDLIQLANGTFRYEAGMVKPGRIARPIGFVLLEAARVMDERAAGRKQAEG